MTFNTWKNYLFIFIVIGLLTGCWYVTWESLCNVEEEAIPTDGNKEREVMVWDLFYQIHQEILLEVVLIKNALIWIMLTKKVSIKKKNWWMA